MDLTGLTPQKLRRAADLQEQIESLQAELAALFGSEEAPRPASVAPVSPAAPTVRGKKGGISAEGRERIAAAARARWAKFHREQNASTGAAPKKKSRRLSPAGRAAIAAAAKARWARERAKAA